MKPSSSAFSTEHDGILSTREAETMRKIRDSTRSAQEAVGMRKIRQKVEIALKKEHRALKKEVVIKVKTELA